MKFFQHLFICLVHFCVISIQLVDFNSELLDSLKDQIKVIEENEAFSFLQQLDKQASDMCYNYSITEWRFATDITDENERLRTRESLSYAKFYKEMRQNVSCFNWRNFKNEELRRQFRLLSNLGVAALPDDQLTEYTEVITTMEKIYSTTKICQYNNPKNCTLNLEPEITKLIASSRNYDELQSIWQQWHDRSGRSMRKEYSRFVQLSNYAANLNNFSDTGVWWRNNYESDMFRSDVEQLWQTLKPIYQQLHAYVRTKLRKFYGEDKIPKNQLIPAHLLGDMWAQNWINIMDIIIPYPNKVSIDVTSEMEKQGYTALRIFKTAEEFFLSLGLLPMPPEFWSGSVLEKLPDREMVCHASAWDFCNKKDYRIKQCTQINMEHFTTAHHEMGHIQYFLQFKDLPFPYRDAANPGFHEAVGDTIALSVQTPKHLKEIGLLDPSVNIDDDESAINFLFAMAVQKIAFLPFAYVVDKWRWDVFDGTILAEDYNCHWWKLREEYQGVKSPVSRSEQDFDPGSKYHIPANVEYIRYFVSTVFEFQFHRALCKEAGQYNPSNPSFPLHKCDIYRSKAAGKKLASMLAMGISRPWPEAMRVMTGQDRMDASAIQEYFKPLEDWLRQQNKETGETIGWIADGKSCERKHTPSGAPSYNSIYLMPLLLLSVLLRFNIF